MEIIYRIHQPTVSESLSNGWQILKKYFLWLFIAVIAGSFANSALRFTINEGEFFTSGLAFMATLGTLFSVLVTPVIRFGVDMVFLEAVRDKEPNLNWLIKGFQKNYLNIILSSLLQYALIGIGFAALIIPGIIIACRLVFVPYLVMDKELDPVRAIEESWRMTQGFGWRIFGLAITSIFILILGIMCLFVGVIPAIIWVKASFASMYQAIDSHRTTNNPYQQ